MEKLALPLLLWSLFCYSSFAGEATILKVSKTMNEKNILHYKIKYDDATCELKGGVYAEWKMDEEDGRWKSLNDSASFIRKPLEPKTDWHSSYELEFVTESMGEFEKKGILGRSQVRVFADLEKGGGCSFRNEALVRGEHYNILRLHSKVTLFGNVKWVEVYGENSSGKSVKLRF